VKPSGWLETVNCSIEGILWAARSQKHMRYHLLAALGVQVVALLLRISALEFVLLTLAVVLVMLAELLNTSLEAVVDLVSPEFHPLARRAKDVAAGAVLVASIGAVVIGYLVLSRYFFLAPGEGFSGLGQPPGMVPVAAVIITVILVVLLKARVNTGSPLHGGMPSGHAAVAFSVATSLAWAGIGTILTVLAVGMAAMVSHSRLLLGIHTLREVLAGIVLGTGVTLLLHLVFAA